MYNLSPELCQGLNLHCYLQKVELKHIYSRCQDGSVPSYMNYSRSGPKSFMIGSLNYPEALRGLLFQNASGHTLRLRLGPCQSSGGQRSLSTCGPTFSMWLLTCVLDHIAVILKVRTGGSRCLLPNLTLSLGWLDTCSVLFPNNRSHSEGGHPAQHLFLRSGADHTPVKDEVEWKSFGDKSIKERHVTFYSSLQTILSLTCSGKATIRDPNHVCDLLSTADSSKIAFPLETNLSNFFFFFFFIGTEK